jgi:Family of unknown function (DUF6220)
VDAAFRYWAWIVYVAVIVQIGFAGYGAFDVAGSVEDSTVDEDQVSDAFGLHLGLGYLIVLSGLILLILAFASRGGRQRVTHSAILFGLLILQVLLAWFGYEAAVIGFFHPINAVALAGLSFWIAWKAWKKEPLLDRVAGGP